MPPHPRDGRKLLGHLGGAHTHHHDHIWRSRLRIRRFELRFGFHTVVCTSSSAARAAMGYWGQCPHTPRMAGHCLVTLGGHTHTSTTTFGVAHTWPTLYSVRIAQCGSGAVRWCAHHLQQLGPQWGIGGNGPTPQGWQDTPWSPSGGTHTPPQPLSALPTPYSTARIAVRVSFGGVHTIFSS